eukprot:snap_masked-scaffold_110-processed-gene-0.15-mRNA-1 protein AED:1.00 eAED:1.00 QI:0/0/0/0/1/1/8/0/304
MIKSIKQQYETRSDKTHLIIQRVTYPKKTKKFKREIEEFVKGSQPDKEVPFIEFAYCPFGTVESIFVRFILCFPAVKELEICHCSFSDENFQNLQQLKNLKLNILEFYYCYIPEVGSFCSLLKSLNIKDIKLTINEFSSINISNIFKSLSFNKTILKIHISEDVQDKVIISGIKNFLKTNKIIKSLIYRQTEPSEKPLEEDIIELQEIVDSHSCILGLQVYKNFIEPIGKTKMLKKLVHSALQNQYQEDESLREVPVILMGDGRTGKTSLLRNLSGKSFQKRNTIYFSFGRLSNISSSQLFRSE